MSNGLVRVSTRAPLARAEEARALALELAPGGFEETETADDIALALYVDESEVERIRAVFPDAEAASVQLGWEDGWRAFHRPVRAGGLWIGPPWAEPGADEPAVVIDPGRAFGTGAHATTRLCIELLARSERGSLLDVGCGSGVLSIAANRLGFGPVVAVDNDPVAVETTAANARANGVAVDVLLLDGERAELPPADVAVANVLLAPVERILARLDTNLAITSGYLVDDLPSAPGWTRLDRLELEGWAADRFVRPVPAAPDRPPSPR
jgi:ribosomal protein L11 methyltransferase